MNYKLTGSIVTLEDLHTTFARKYKTWTIFSQENITIANLLIKKIKLNLKCILEKIMAI